MRTSHEDAAIELAIRQLLEARGAGKTICPSEASRHVFGPSGLEAERMQQTRRVARHMIARGELEMTQRGQVVDPVTARGPVRLRLPWI